MNLIVALTVIGYTLVIAAKILSKKPLMEGMLMCSGLMSFAVAFWSATPEQYYHVISYTVWVAVVAAVFSLLGGALKEAGKP